MAAFALHPRLEADSIWMRDLGLCQLRLNNVKAVLWLVLVPRRADVKEIYELAAADRALLTEEIAQTAQALSVLCAPDKINIASLGNVVPQLHVHVMARFKHDCAWPNPVFGQVPSEPYDEQAVATIKAKFENVKIGT